MVLEGHKNRIDMSPIAACVPVLNSLCILQKNNLIHPYIIWVNNRSTYCFIRKNNNKSLMKQSRPALNNKGCCQAQELISHVKKTLLLFYWQHSFLLLRKNKHCFFQNCFWISLLIYRLFKQHSCWNKNTKQLLLLSLIKSNPRHCLNLWNGMAVAKPKPKRIKTIFLPFFNPMQLLSLSDS